MPKIIEGQPVSGFVDHDYEKIKNFSLKEKIEWFEYRFNKTLLYPVETIREAVKKDREAGKSNPLEDENTSIFTIVALVICVGIDLLGGFLSGREDDNERGVIKRDFRLFACEYLDPREEYLRSPYKSKDELWELLYESFRNGLAHNLTIKEIGFCYGEEYFKEGDGNYYVSVDRLFDDLKCAFLRYMTHVKENKDGLRDKFRSRFEHVFINRR